MSNPIQTLILDCVQVTNQTKVDATLMSHIKTEDRMQLLAYEDSYARRTILRAFGKSARLEMSCPATWWQHVKHALKERWPRLFRWLRPQYRQEYAETGAVVAGLEPIAASHMVIPYVIAPNYPGKRR